MVDKTIFGDEVFTLNEIKSLQSIPIAKANDSSFVLQCIQYAYKADPSILRYRTLKGIPERIEINPDGTEEHHPAKNPLTPTKVERIQELFIERVSNYDECC